MITAANGSSESGWDAGTWVSLGAAIVALIAVAVTVWQAQFAKSQASSAKTQAEAAVRATELQEKLARDAAQPYIWADFRLDYTQGGFMLLVVHNQGATVAEDVRVVFEPALRTHQGMDVQPVHDQLARGLDSMPPGREMKFGFATHRLFEPDAGLPLSYTVTINARGPHGPVPELRYVLDLSEMAGVLAPNHGSLHEVAKAIGPARTQQLTPSPRPGRHDELPRS